MLYVVCVFVLHLKEENWILCSFSFSWSPCLFCEKCHLVCGGAIWYLHSIGRMSAASHNRYFVNLSLWSSFISWMDIQIQTEKVLIIIPGLEDFRIAPSKKTLTMFVPWRWMIAGLLLDTYLIQLLVDNILVVSSPATKVSVWLVLKPVR